MSSLVGQKLLIRADAKQQMGTGHVMRCLALAQAWQDAGGCATFVMTSKAPKLEARLKLEGMELVFFQMEAGSKGDAYRTVQLARWIGADWLVVDGYQFDTNYQRIIKEADLHLMVIDDNGHASHYWADVVLNQNLHASEGLYINRESDTRLLLGTKYVMLRREFSKWRGLKRAVPETAYRTLITLGGCDSENVTSELVKALLHRPIDDLEVAVVSGSSNPHYHALKAVVCKSPLAIRVMQNVTDMPELMAWSDMVVSAGGSTCWESAFMGLPAILIVNAENQVEVARCTEKAGMARNLGWATNLYSSRFSSSFRALLNDPRRRLKMSIQGRKLVDGLGAERVCTALVSEGLYLRPANQTDCCLLWRWANAPLARGMSLNSSPIPFKDHIHWFERKMASKKSLILILEHKTLPVGQIRFDLDAERNAHVSIYVDQPYRGQSLGTYLLKEGTKHYLNRQLDNDPIRSVIGRVRSGNLSSCRIFEKAGYRRVGSEIVRGMPLVRFVHTVAETDRHC
jgi:UDP-2,4-diacetamido-2,4,6-trideoxy-beta-L-altropyranose hydrolase